MKTVIARSPAWRSFVTALEVGMGAAIASVTATLSAGKPVEWTTAAIAGVVAALGYVYKLISVATEPKV
jgi:hypothetical protein